MKYSKLRAHVVASIQPSAKSPRILFTLSRLAVLAVVAGMSLQAFSSTVQVGNCVPTIPSYPTITQAINSVPAGSTIKICPNTYKEQLTISKNLTLIGEASNGNNGNTAAGFNNPVVAVPAGGLTVNANDLADGSAIAAQIGVVPPPGTSIMVSISNLSVDGSNNGLTGCGTDLVGIYYQNSSGTINHVATRFQELTQDLFGCQVGLGIYAQSGYSTSGTSVVTIEASSVHDYQKNGITVDGQGTNATVSGNYVVGIGATSLIAQNGIQVSDGAYGKVLNNTVSDDVYINAADCSSNNSCYSATGILLYDSGGTSALPFTVNANTVSDAQGGIVAYSAPSSTISTADYNNVTSNKITTSPAAGPYLLDGIDLCSNFNTVTSNIVFNSSGAGIHIDSSCSEPAGTSGNGTMVKMNTINEACAGVLLGYSNTNTVTSNSTFNVVQVTQGGDSCPAGSPSKALTRLKPHPWHP